ncbi:MAG: glucan biosynthesis protein [Akkermansiaceae bacterium]|nr:glucan biosynthesis protein [Akkermansiaceae bacterium]
MLAAKPHRPSPLRLDDFWKSLSYDQHRDIRFQMDKGLWAEDGLPFSIDFFHPGWTAKEMVDIHEVVGGESRPLEFDRSLFDYGKNKIPADVPSPPGYAGWRARCHLNSPDYMDEFLVFLGASYFRAIPKDSPYGLSARGLSINSGLPGVPEEFPVFTRFDLKRPAKDDTSLTAWALLDGEASRVPISSRLRPGGNRDGRRSRDHAAQAVQQLGLAPFSSMYWFGEGTLRSRTTSARGARQRRLLMELKRTCISARFRAPHNRFRHCVFTLEKPRSWMLVQRDRQFVSYQDKEARYHERPV